MKLFYWMKSFLRSLAQTVKVSDYVSIGFIVNSGALQGSHLDLFILFINDLHFILDILVYILIFADDAKLFSIMNSPSDNLNS